MFDVPAGCVAMAMYHLNESIRDFACMSLNYDPGRNYPVYLSIKKTIFKQHDGRFKEIFEEIYEAEFKAEYGKTGLYY